MTETYAQASRSLLRNSLLDGLRGLLLERDWSAVRMSDVAAAAGVSRQTVYNEFGTRYGLAQAYAQRLAAQLAAIVGAAVRAAAPEGVPVTIKCAASATSFTITSPIRPRTTRTRRPPTPWRE